MGRMARKIARSSMPKRPVCPKCNKRFNEKAYMLLKEDYGWVCPKCGYVRRLKE